jgi:hypothetical protein
MKTFTIETKTGKYTPEQIKAAKARYSAGDFGGAQTSAIKAALKYQKTIYLFATYYGYKTSWEVPSLPGGFYYEIIPTGKLSITMNKNKLGY